MADPLEIGRRIAVLRTDRGLTQQALSDRARLSKSLLSKVETGARPASTMLVAACARALGVDSTAITGQTVSVSTAGLATLRTSLDLLDTAPSLDVLPRSLRQLRAAVHRINRAAQAARYVEVSQGLPALLGELHTATETTTGADVPRVWALLAEAARVGHTAGIGLGHPDISPLALARVDQAAQHAGQAGPGWRAIRDYLRITAALRLSDYDACWRLHTSALRHLEAAHPDDPGVPIAHGQLHLGAAVISARTGALDDTADHLDAADRIARNLPTVDLERFWVGFCSANVAAHRVITAVERGDYALAVRAAEQIDIPDQWLPSRVGHLHLDLARARLWMSDSDGAMTELLRARAVAPQQARRHPSAQTTITALLRQSRPTRTVRSYAAWMDLTSRSVP